MLENLSLEDSQKIAESLIQDLVDNAELIDLDSISSILRDGIREDYVQDLIATLIGINVSDLDSWINKIIEEPGSNEEY